MLVQITRLTRDRSKESGWIREHKWIDVGPAPTTAEILVGNVLWYYEMRFGCQWFSWQDATPEEILETVARDGKMDLDQSCKYPLSFWVLGDPMEDILRALTEQLERKRVCEGWAIKLAEKYVGDTAFENLDLSDSGVDFWMMDFAEELFPELTTLLIRDEELLSDTSVEVHRRLRCLAEGAGLR